MATCIEDLPRDITQASHDYACWLTGPGYSVFVSRPARAGLSMSMDETVTITTRSQIPQRLQRAWR